MVPQRSPAPSAAAMPIMALRVAPPDWCAVAYAVRQAPATMAVAPPSTLAHCRGPASRSSRNRSHPQNRPTRLFVFQRGKATDRPTSRMANTVSVFATAQIIPASSAQTTRCGFWRRSAQT